MGSNTQKLSEQQTGSSSNSSKSGESHKSSESSKSVDTETFELAILSFGFKAGHPPKANCVFDVRFLENPFWVEELRPLTGKDKPVQDYVLAQKAAQDFLATFVQLVAGVLPRFIERGGDRYVIALGCTGGQHRSATLVEVLGKRMREAYPNFAVSIQHRELDRHSPHFMSAVENHGVADHHGVSENEGASENIGNDGTDGGGK
jgi:RNase adaptor protein for sRNA GlmZ degradation